MKNSTEEKNETTAIQEGIENTNIIYPRQHNMSVELCPTKEAENMQQNIGDPARQENSKELYFDSLSQWAVGAAHTDWMSHYLLMLNYTFYQRYIAAMTLQWSRMASNVERLNVEDAEYIRGHGAKQMLIAPFWKRIIAEILDGLFLLFAKVFVGFIVFSHFYINSNKSIDLPQDRQMMIFLHNIMAKCTLSFDLLVFLFMSQIIACWYECLWNIMVGVTPGKYIMNLRIFYVKSLIPIHPVAVYQFILNPQAISVLAFVYPGRRPNWITTFERSFVKNMILPTVFPLFMVMLFLKNNRTSYDVIIHTAVIEVQPRRRRR